MSVGRFDFHPLADARVRAASTVDGEPARLVASDDPTRVRFLPGVGGLDVEFVARDVPAFGCRRYALAPAGRSARRGRRRPRDRDGEVTRRAADDGTLTVTLGGAPTTGSSAIEDCVDRGDSYDADPDPPA